MQSENVYRVQDAMLLYATAPLLRKIETAKSSNDRLDAWV